MFAQLHGTIESERQQRVTAAAALTTIPRQGGLEAMATRVYFTAGQRFGCLVVSASPSQRHGRNRRWLCDCDCGSSVWVIANNLRSGNTSSCGCLRRALFAARTGTANPAWKGGHVTKGGYRVLLVDGRLIPEQRVVMARHLRRPLLRAETVHHKNGDRLDNRLENLELWSSSHPSGQRVADKLAWAREFIALYEP